MPVRSAFYPLLVLIASLLMMVIGTGSVYLLVVALKPITVEFGWPRSIASMAYALQFFGAGAGGVVVGFWLDRSGMAKPALLGAIMIGLGSVLTSYADQPWHFWLIYGLMMGLLGRATLFSPLMSNITHWFNKRRGFAVGILGSGQALAGGLWPPVFQYGLENLGWRTTALLYGLLVLAVMVPVTAVFRRPAPKQSPSTVSGSHSQSRLLNEPLLLITLCAASVGCCVAMALPLAHLIAYISDIGFAPARGAEMLSLALLTAAFSSMVGVGFLSGRLGGLTALLCFSCVQTLALALMLSFNELNTLYIIAVVFGLGYGNDRMFARLANAMKRPELAAPQHFGTVAVRLERRAEVNELVTTWTSSLLQEEVLERCRENEVPSGPIHNIADIFTDAQYAARENLIKMFDDRVPEITMPCVLPRLSATPGHIEKLGPTLGEHSKEVLEQLVGVDAEAFKSLTERGIV